MWQTVGCNVHRAAGMGVLMQHVEPAAARGLLTAHRSLMARRPLAGRAPQRQICAMSYAQQAYQDPAATQRSNRVYTNFAIYKGSAAMNFKVIKPSWEYRADGALALKDAGVALLEFAPAQAGSGSQPGERRYDWDNKTNIALSPTELGDLIETINGGQSGKAIYHDPNKGRTGEGVEGKSLNITPGTRGVKEIYLNLLHKVRGQADKKVSVSLTAGEMVVFKRLSEYIIPHLLGFDELFQFDGGMDSGPGDGLGADFGSAASPEAAPVAMPTSAPF